MLTRFHTEVYLAIRRISDPRLQRHGAGTLKDRSSGYPCASSRSLPSTARTAHLREAAAQRDAPARKQEEAPAPNPHAPRPTHHGKEPNCSRRKTLWEFALPSGRGGSSEPQGCEGGTAQGPKVPPLPATSACSRGGWQVAVALAEQFEEGAGRLLSLGGGTLRTVHASTCVWLYHASIPVLKTKKQEDLRNVTVITAGQTSVSSRPAYPT